MTNKLSTIDKLNELLTHPFYKNYFKKFKEADYLYLHYFLLELKELNQDQKVLAVTRSAMRENKPKHWKEIEELLSIAIKE